MSPKVAAAIITGTMASPSRPSVRFTALPAPTMTKLAERRGRTMPSGISDILEERNARGEERDGARPSACMASVAGDERDHGLDGKPQPAARSPCAICLRHLQVIVVEADRAEAEVTQSTIQT